MTTFRNLILGLVLLFGGFAATQAYAQGNPQIETARATGVIGERIDGYLGVVGSADAEIVRQVQDINNRRRALYERTAGETGTTVQQVARIAGEKQLAERVKPGEFYMDATGTWKQK